MSNVGGRRHSTGAILSNSHKQGRQRPAGEEGWEALAASAISAGLGPYPPRARSDGDFRAAVCCAARLLWSGERRGWGEGAGAEGDAQLGAHWP